MALNFLMPLRPTLLRLLRHPVTFPVVAFLLSALTMWLMWPSAKYPTLTAGHSVEGRAIEYSVHGYGPRVILFMASIHGSEGAGTPLLQRFQQSLAKNPAALRGHTVLIMPVANPDGLQRGDRLNTHGVDLNRNFAADNRRDSGRFGLTPLSEPESRAIAALIEKHQPQLVVSIHQPLECIDWDGPPETEALANRLAGSCGLPVKKLGARPGSLGAWFGEALGRPILTMELPRGSPVDPAGLWSRFGPGLIELLRPVPE